MGKNKKLIKQDTSQRVYIIAAETPSPEHCKGLTSRSWGCSRCSVPCFLLYIGVHRRDKGTCKQGGEEKK